MTSEDYIALQGRFWRFCFLAAILCTLMGMVITHCHHP